MRQQQAARHAGECRHPVKKTIPYHTMIVCPLDSRLRGHDDRPDSKVCGCLVEILILYLNIHLQHFLFMLYLCYIIVECVWLDTSLFHY